MNAQSSSKTAFAYCRAILFFLVLLAFTWGSLSAEDIKDTTKPSTADESLGGASQDLIWDINKSLQQALYQYQLKEYNLAVEKMEGLLKQLREYPKASIRSEILFFLGEAKYKIDLFSAASQNYEQLLASFPNDAKYAPIATYRLLWIGVREQNKEKIQKYYDLIQKDPRYSKYRDHARYVLGEYYMKMKEPDFTKAISILQGVSSNGPQELQASAYVSLGTAYWKQKKITEAATAFERAKQVKGPRNSEAYGKASYFLGNYWYEKKLYEKAKDEYLDVDEDAGMYYFKSLSGIGWCYLNLKDYEKAIKYFEKLQVKTKDYDLAGEALTLIGHCQFKLGKFEKAIETYRQVMKNYPKNSNNPEDSDWALEAKYEILLPYFGLFMKAQEKYGASSKDWNKIDEPAKLTMQYADELIKAAGNKKDSHSLLAYAWFYKAEILTWQEMSKKTGQSFEEPIRIYNEIITSFKDSPFYKEALWGLGWAYYNTALANIDKESLSQAEADKCKDNAKKAIEAWEILLEKFPDFSKTADAAMAAADAYVNVLPAFDTNIEKDDTKYWAKAMPLYQKALTLKDISPKQRFNLTLLLAISYMKLDQYNRAVEFLTEAFTLGTSQGQQDEAVDKAAVLFTQHAEAKKDVTGIILFEKYLSIKPAAISMPSTRRIMDKMADKYQTQFKYDRAISTLRLMNRLYPNDPNISSVHWRISELSKSTQNAEGWQNAMESFLETAKKSTDKETAEKVNIALFQVTSKIREKLATSKVMDSKSIAEFEKMLKMSKEYLERNPSGKTVEYYAMLVNMADAQMALKQHELAGDSYLKLATELEQTFPNEFLKGIEAFKDKTKQDYIQFCVSNAFSNYQSVLISAEETKNKVLKDTITPKIIKASEFYERVGTDPKTYALIMIEHGDALLDQKKWDEALVVYNKYLTKYPNEVDHGIAARQSIAYCQQMKMQWIDAAKAFLEVERFARLNSKRTEAEQALEATQAQYWLIAFPNAASKMGAQADTSKTNNAVKGDLLLSANYLKGLSDYAVTNGYPEQAKKIMGNVLRLYNDTAQESPDKAIELLASAQLYCKAKGFDELVKAANGYIVLIYTNKSEKAFKAAEESKNPNEKAMSYIVSAQWEQKKADYLKTTTGIVKEEEKIVFMQNTAALYSKAAKAIEDKGEAQTGEDKALLQGYYNKIIDLFDQIIVQIKDQKQQQDYRAKIVFIMRKTNKWREAASMIHEMGEKETDQAKKIDYFLAEIDTYREQKDLETVQKLMKEYVGRFPSDKEHAFDFAATIALLYFDKGQMSVAETEMKNAIKVYSNQQDARIAQLHFNLGVIEESRSNFDKAYKEWYSKVNDFPVPELIAQVYFKQANQSYDKIQKAGILDKLGAEKKAELMKKIGDSYAKVVSTINAAIDKNPAQYQKYANATWYKKSLDMANNFIQGADLTSKAGEAVKNILEIKDDFGRQAIEARKKWYQKYMSSGN